MIEFLIKGGTSHDDKKAKNGKNFLIRDNNRESHRGLGSYTKVLI